MPWDLPPELPRGLTQGRGFKEMESSIQIEIASTPVFDAGLAKVPAKYARGTQLSSQSNAC